MSTSRRPADWPSVSHAKPVDHNGDERSCELVQTPGAQESSVDERFRSLMEGLRTTLPGAQVMVAFLLVLPVQSEFSLLSTVDLIAYYVAFAAAMLASVLLIAPSVHQRVRSPISGVTRGTEHHLQAAVRLTIAGTVLLMVALTSVSYLVTSLVVTSIAAAVSAAVLAAVAGYAWFYQPLVVFNRDRPAGR